MNEREGGMKEKRREEYSEECIKKRKGEQMKSEDEWREKWLKRSEEWWQEKKGEKNNWKEKRNHWREEVMFLKRNERWEWLLKKFIIIEMEND